MTREVVAKKIEIVRQVKLTPKQRFTLMAMANNGGRDRHVDWNVKPDLVALGLIEERDALLPAEKRAVEVEIREKWKQAGPLVKAKDTGGLGRLMDNIRSKERELIAKAFWLTPAAEEYLIKGKVTIVR